MSRRGDRRGGGRLEVGQNGRSCDTSGLRGEWEDGRPGGGGGGVRGARYKAPVATLNGVKAGEVVRQRISLH